MARALGEFGRIAALFRPLATGFPGALDLTDDAAILSIPPGRELVVTTDAIVAGVHFLPDGPPGEVARKALRVNLSDLAAKGAAPLAYTLTLALGRDVADEWVAHFAAGLADDQARYGIALAGGDSVSTAGPLWVSITAFGTVALGGMIRRAGAQAGDRLMVTGTIGDGALGLKLLRGEIAEGPGTELLVRRYRRPEPRCGLANAIAQSATAALDVSDGLAADCLHLCRASGVRAEIAVGRVPLSDPTSRLVAQDAALWPQILGGGDDYEVLMAVPQNRIAALQAAADAADIGLTDIGFLKSGAPEVRLIGPDGSLVALDRPGWTHS